VARRGLEPLPLPALIANENLRFDGWSNHVSWTVFSFGKEDSIVSRFRYPLKTKGFGFEKGTLFQGGPCFSTKLAPFVFEPDSFESTDHPDRAGSGKSSHGRNRHYRSHRMDSADRSAQELRAGHDRDESNYGRRFDCGKRGLVSARGSGCQQEGHDFGAGPRRRSHRPGSMRSPALSPRSSHCQMADPTASVRWLFSRS
jgi:hypothetical protein